MSDATERAAFEQWLGEVHGLTSEWQEERNCYAQFAAHIAYRAWQKSGARIAQLEESLAKYQAARVHDVDEKAWLSAKATRLEAALHRAYNTLENITVANSLSSVKDQAHAFISKYTDLVESLYSTPDVNLCGYCGEPNAGSHDIRACYARATAETASEPIPKLPCGMGCGRTFASPEGLDHHEELCDGTAKNRGTVK